MRSITSDSDQCELQRIIERIYQWMDLPNKFTNRFDQSTNHSTDNKQDEKSMICYQLDVFDIQLVY